MHRTAASQDNGIGMALFDPYGRDDPPPPPPPPADDGWYFPGTAEHPLPPPVWPYYWEPAAPRSPRRRAFSVVAALLLLVALVGAGVGVAVSRLTAGSPALSQPVVDINVALADGDSAAGTGIVLNSSGEVLTNNHVVANSDHVSVETPDGASYSATVVGVDPSNDVAVIQVSGVSGLPTAKIGDSSRLQVGDAVTAVGNALGRGGPPVSTSGHVTGLGQTITATDDNGGNAETLNNMIEFDANIQQGDSGGPLYDSSGQVVGVDTAGSGRVGRPTFGGNQGFAIPINAAIGIAHQITSGSPAPNVVRGHRGLLGVSVQDSASPAGALVVGVQSGSPAESAGITANDVIVKVNGSTVTSVRSLRTALQSSKPGDSVSVSWLDPSGAEHAATLQLINGGIP
jgi:S1-C subfamily serine protease